MKEKVKGRKKKFWALILAVIIGMLPTVEVWAETFKVSFNNPHYIDIIRDGSSVVSGINTGGGGKYLLLRK